MTNFKKNKRYKSTLKTVLVTCTALAAYAPGTSTAQLSIMGVLDTRARFTPQQASPAPAAPHANPIETQSPVPSFTPKNAEAPKQEIAPTTAQSASGFSANEVGFHKELGVITAHGDVEIVSGDQVLIADTVSYNQNKNLVTASGNVQIIQENGNVIFSEFVEITSNLKEGVARKMRMSLADNSSLEAEKALRKGGRYTIAQKASYSPCQKCKDDPERPLAWKLTANEVQHDAEQRRMEYSDVFLEIYDIPVLYFPYFTHPDPTRKRETGFLTPSFGSRGSLEGFLTTPFFYNISPSKDLTVEPTWYYGLNQPHMSAEYRQHLKAGEIRLAGSLTYADGGAGSTNAENEEFRGHIDSEGRFDLNDTWRLGFDLNHASDETYIRRYGQENKAQNGHLVSDLYVEGFRNRNYINASINAYQEQKTETPADLQDGMLEYQFSHVSQPISTGAYWKLDAGAYGIKRKNETQTSRLAADTSWVIPYTSDTGDIYTLDANLATTVHYASKLSIEEISDDYSGAQFRTVPSLTLEWRKPLSRTQMGGSVNEIFEPIIKLKAAPNVGNNEKIPNEDSQDFEFDDTNLFKTNRFTGLDRIDGGQRVDFGFNWGAYGQEGGYSQLFVGQSYRFREDGTYDTNSGHEDKISDIVGRVQVSPSGFLDVLYRYRLDKNDLTLNRSETQLSMGPQSTRFSMSHLLVEGSGADSEYGTREEISGRLTNQISKNFYSTIDARYRMNDPEGTVTYGGQFGYKDECTTIYLDARRNFSEDRDIKPTDSITLRFELKNLGGIGTF